MQEMTEQKIEELWQYFEGPNATPEAVEKQPQCIDFLDRLYRLKMDNLMRAANSTALRCAACGILFSASHISRLQCRADARWAYYIPCCLHTRVL